jgi:type II secretion system (T2SS) protein E
MKYSRKYHTVGHGMHAPDERFYRADKAQACAQCSAMTEWCDVSLDVPLCSEECRLAMVGTPTPPPPAQPLVGQLLFREGLITEAQLEHALRVQHGLDTYTPIGQVLVEQKAITLKQLNALLDRYRKRPKLGAVLVAAKVITRDQLQQAMTVQRPRGLRLGDVLIRLGFATEQQIKQAICIQLNLPFIDLKAFKLDGKAELPKLIKRLYAERYRVVPIAKLGTTLTVAMDDPTDAEVVRTVEASTGLVVNVVTATRAGLEHAVAEVYD